MNKLIKAIIVMVLVFLPLLKARAMPIGTLLYRSSGGDKMYGLNSEDLIVSENGKLSHIYSGHAAIYVGKENNIDYIVEMQPKGAIKVQAKYFINEAAGEKLVAAKLPAKASPLQIATAVAIAKNLAAQSMDYDFDFKYQKGPHNGEWTCVGLTEKIYESANVSNPTNLSSLEYNKDYYAVDITPDGYDNNSIYNKDGDCFSNYLEYSKIAAKRNMIIPAPEILGYDVGLEYDAERYIFLPYTQALQPSLKDVKVDIALSSNFNEPEIRGESPVLALILKWSLINNPISTVKNLFRGIETSFAYIKNKVFPDNSIALADKEDLDNVSKPIIDIKASSSSIKKMSKVTSVKTTASKTAVSKAKAKTIPIKNTFSDTTSTLAKTSQQINTAPVVYKNEDIAPATRVSMPRTTTRPASIRIAEVPTRTISTTTPIIVVVTTTPIIIQIPINNTPTTTNNDSSNEPEPEPEKQIALIAKIYSNGSDDWLEIVNTSESDLDLAEAGYRLEKAKTGSDPTLVMRIGDENDGIYPGGTIVSGHGSYVIVNDESSEEMLAKADAIAIKDTFTWSENAYTLYLGTASISSDTDIDIVDKLGYGEATYFESAPAPALKKGYSLERRASINSTLESMASGGAEEFWPRLFDSNDNSSDFLLIPFDEALIEEDNQESTNPPVTNADLYKSPAGLDSEGLIHLWHFDECYDKVAFNELEVNGQVPVDLEIFSEWGVGRWGCSTSLGSHSSSTKAVFKPSLDMNQFSLNFYYRNNSAYSSFYISFYNTAENGRSASLEFTPHYTGINGFPGFSGRVEDVKWPTDNKWHQVSMIVDRDKGYWALYLDAKEVYRYEYSGVIPEFKYMNINGSTGSLTDFDELSFWNRSLPISELKMINILDQPFNPYTWPQQQKEAELTHHWGFNENAGSLANDIVTQENIEVSSDQWNMEGASSSALTIGNKIKGSFPKTYIEDLSLSFWWRNISSENEGRLSLNLKEDDKTILSFRPTPYNSSFGFNTCGGVFVQYPGFYIPNDKEWHHFTLTYDSYRYLFKFYVDGIEKYTKECVKLKEGRFIDTLEVIGENWPSVIDEVKIWKGVLFQNQITAEFNAINN